MRYAPHINANSVTVEAHNQLASGATLENTQATAANANSCVQSSQPYWFS